MYNKTARPFIGLSFLYFYFLLALNSVAGQVITPPSPQNFKGEPSKLAMLIQTLEEEDQIFNKKRQSLKAYGTLPTKELDGTLVALHAFGTDGTPLYYSTLASPTSKVSRAHTLYSGGALDLGITGKGMEVGVWDSGIALETHQEFDGRITKGDGATQVDYHATMVTGVLASSGIKQEAQGVAYEAEVLTHNWTRDRIEVAEAAANGLLLSNHSYGIRSDRVPDWYFGSYIKISQDWDNIMYNAPYYLMVTASGNARNSYDNIQPNYGKTQDGFDLLLGFTTAKNGLVVASAETRLDADAILKQAEVSSYSSFGPTDDGRIKPDIAGDGALINSTSDAGDTSYSTLRGTSMAAPGVTGSLVLLQAYHGELYGSYMKAATLKGLTLHTADDVQAPGPDYKMGWGVINTKKAAEVLVNQDYSSLLLEETLLPDTFYSTTVTANGKDPLSVSISWTDPASESINRGELNATQAALVNDLDIRITKNDKTYYPWKLSAASADSPAAKGDNSVDPFERIDIMEASGEYTITVTHKGGLAFDQQDFTIIASGVRLSNCSLAPPTSIVLDKAQENSVSWYWGAVTETLYEVQTKTSDSGHWTTHRTWENQITMSGLEHGRDYNLRIRAVCTENLASDFSEEVVFTFDGAKTKTKPSTPQTEAQEISLAVFPNPATESIAVQHELSRNATYSIKTLSGFNIKQGDASEKINVSDLATGVYLLSVRDAQGVRSVKFFKK